MSTTTNLGMYQVASTSPDYENGNSPIALISTSLATLDGFSAVTVYSASGAIGVTQGVVVLTKSTGVAAMTLALPVAGLPSASGNDGQVLHVMSTHSEAHTITTPASGINGAHTVITFTSLGDYCNLVAYNGSWWLAGSTSGVTITT